MKISIIIPAYNAENTIEKCLKSILEQTYKNLEIIVINDGSKDNTFEICKKYSLQDKRIILINQKNHGVSYSRNLGIKKSTGEYITFADADDFLDKNCIETLIKNTNENIDFVRYNFKTIGPNHNNELYDLENRTIDNHCNINSLFKHFLTFNEPIPNFTWLLFIKSSIAKEIKFDINLTMLEDADFYNQLILKTQKSKFINNTLYNYYVNPLSCTHNATNYKKNIFSIIKANKIIRERSQNILSKEIEKDMNANYLRLISNYLIEIYNINKINYRNLIHELNHDNHYLNMLNNANLNSIPLKNKILLILIKFKNIPIQYVYILLFLNIKKLLKNKHFIY